MTLYSFPPLDDCICASLVPGHEHFRRQPTHGTMDQDEDVSDVASVFTNDSWTSTETKATEEDRTITVNTEFTLDVKVVTQVFERDGVIPGAETPSSDGYTWLPPPIFQYAYVFPTGTPLN